MEEQQRRPKWSRLKQAWRNTTIGNQMIVVLTFVIAVSNLSYVLYGRWQWQVLNAQLGEMAKQYPELQTSANAAKSAADTAAAALRLDQRAWIVVRYPTIPLTEGVPLVVPLTFENIGKTVAKHIRGLIAVYVLKAGEDPDLNYGPGHTHYSFGPAGTFIPNAPEVRNWIAIREGKQIVLTPVMHKEIIDGRSLITIHGKIEYEDIFGSMHWLTFCQQTGGGVMRASASDNCSQYNQTDD